MLTIYWICFVVGGVFVALAVLGGLDGIDFDTQIDMDMELSDPGDRLVNGAYQALRFGFAIVRSLKFWTFGLCFFGLTGIALSSLMTGISKALIPAIAIGVGCLLGGLMAGSLQVLRNRHVDSLVRSTDLIGLAGIVELPFDATTRGKICLNVKGSTVYFTAYTDEPKTFQVGDSVLVVGLDQDRLWVVAAAIETTGTSSSRAP